MTKERKNELICCVRLYEEYRAKGSKLPDVIDAAAKAAGDGLAPYLMANVAHRVTYEQMRAPCSRNTLYRARERFLQELDRTIDEVMMLEAARKMGGKLPDSDG